MVQWRELGVVQDSDDDVDSLVANAEDATQTENPGNISNEVIDLSDGRNVPSKDGGIAYSPNPLTNKSHHKTSTLTTQALLGSAALFSSSPRSASNTQSSFGTSSPPNISSEWDVPDSPRPGLTVRTPSITHPQESENRDAIAATLLSGRKSLLNAFSSSSSLSSLSSLGNSPAILPQSPLPSAVQSRVYPQVNIGISRGNAFPIASSHADDDLGVALQDENVAPIERTRILRTRNPIQLHPYLLENEKYRQSLRARGLRPVVIARESSPARAGTGDNARKSEEDVWQADEDIADPTRGDSEDPYVIFLDHNDRQVSVEASDEEFPDLDTLLRREIPGEIRNGFKKRRMNTTFRIPKGLQEADIMKPKRDILNVHFVRTESSNVYEIPISPTISRLPANKDHHTSSIEGHSSQTHLLTPLASSELDRIHAQPLDFDSDSDPDASPTQRAPLRKTTDGEKALRLDHAAIVSSADDSDASESDVQIRKVQKKIRGVLPASWLRLDHHAQHTTINPSKRRYANAMSPDISPQKGVARRIKRIHHESDRPLGMILEISDDSEPAIPLSIAANRSISPFLRRDHRSQERLMVVDDGFEMMEDDWIDPMFPSTTRSHNSRHKKQTRLPNFVQTSEARPVKDHRGQSESSRRRTNSSVRDRPAKRRSPPKLSILDAPEPSRTFKTPPFIKLAARQARSRRDLGRDSLSSKFMSMHNRDEGVEIDNILQGWKNCQIKQKDISPRPNTKPRQCRLPFSELSGNQGTAVERSHHVQVRSKSRPEARKQTRLQPRAFSTVSINAVNPRSNTEDSLAQIANANSRHKTSSSVKGSRAEIRDRPGQLETLQSDVDARHPKAAFSRELVGLNRQFQRDGGSRHNPRLAKFLEDDDDPVIDRSTQDQHDNQPEVANMTPVKKQVKRRPWKRVPHQVKIDLIDAHRPMSSTLDSFLSPITSASEISGPILPKLQGLGPYGTHYTTDFGIGRLPSGSYFHQSTFIGSGGLSDALRICSRDLDSVAGHTVITVDSLPRRWGCWTQEVAIEMQQLSKDIISNIHADQQRAIKDTTSLARFRSWINYFARNLSFLDAIDRDNFVIWVVEVLENILEALLLYTAVNANPLRPSKSFSSLALQFMTLVTQLLIVSKHSLVSHNSKKKSEALFLAIAKALANATVSNGFTHLADFHERHNLNRVQVTGIKDEDYVIEAIVGLHHLHAYAEVPGLNFWDTINESLSHCTPEFCEDAVHFEKLWHIVFSIMPLLDISTTGLIEKETPLYLSDDTPSNWDLIKKILARLYHFRTSGQEQANMNSYIRATLSRCYRLVRAWKWYKCEHMLGCTFGFFAGHALKPLRHEENIHSSFLDKIYSDMRPRLESEDSAFEIFLKILANALLGMRLTYPEKKIQNLTWRYIPNHGRTHTKEHALGQEDLDAIKNHHDLLCVLYYASPPSKRPKIGLIKGLVDHKTAHSEVSRLNMRAWANLVRFQFSTHEPSTSLHPFLQWVNEFFTDAASLHRLARSEAESIYNSANGQKRILTREMLESTVQSNQRQIVAVLETTLSNLSQILQNAKSSTNAEEFGKGVEVAKIFALFDSKQKQVNQAVCLALDVYQNYLELVKKRVVPPKTMQASEESQDYGDWPVDDALEGVAAPHEDLDKSFADPVTSLLSNAFGQEHVMDDHLLSKIVDTWTFSAELLVRAGHRDWSYYLEQHSTGSWYQLRDTVQTKQYTSYFFAATLSADPESFNSNPTVYISAWLSCLVERKSMLKYQHQLTAALLNIAGDHVLFQNPPFARSTDGLYHVSFDELRERRLSIISSILANLRQAFEARHHEPTTHGHISRQEYTELIKRIMDAMRKNFQDTEQGSEVRESYVIFVQTVVQYLQQYTSDICPVDRYFTDSTAFPLPSNDPLYVVGRMKSYEVKANDQRSQKILTTFLQNVCERAVAEGQQEYLVDQLKTSTMDVFQSSANNSSLHCVLLGGLFPAYIELSLTTETGWLLAIPILEASQHMLGDLLTSFDLADAGCIKAIRATLDSFLEAAHASIMSKVDDSDILQQPQILLVMHHIFDCATAALPTIDYISRFESEEPLIVRTITSLANAAKRLERLFNNLPSSLDETHGQSKNQHPFANLQAFATRQLGETLRHNWVKHGEEYYTVRGNSRRRVFVEIGSVQGETVDLTEAIKEFLAAFGGMSGIVPQRETRPLVSDISLFV